MNAIKRPALVFLFIGIAIIIGLDQWTKAIATDLLTYARPVEVLPILNWTLLHNRGAAFSFLSDQGGWQLWFFTGISLVVSVVFTVWMARAPVNEWLIRYSLMFIIGGAIGNLIDRVRLNYVVDFIHFHWQQYYFPAFNIADMAITLGAGLMILEVFLNPGGSEKADDTSPAA
ncbi:Lipoprotein signal peptidase [BD1-7 clade bacterium]|uniref:Lipoprotein signal peptidase n=1 Tax=BD1-7 clade bacterium TaxID=2029982 RepID=A0A5S9PVL1_9GAMM|nr:Lipoprotein signal peptidase [BD1-7 clade bacterium]CAA0108802.1 Lipoprotein signal peptidase [BD1-7 clade bacterium]